MFVWLWNGKTRHGDFPKWQQSFGDVQLQTFATSGTFPLWYDDLIPYYSTKQTTNHKISNFPSVHIPNLHFVSGFFPPCIEWWAQKFFQILQKIPCPLQQLCGMYFVITATEGSVVELKLANRCVFTISLSHCMCWKGRKAYSRSLFFHQAKIYLQSPYPEKSGASRIIVNSQNSIHENICNIVLFKGGLDSRILYPIKQGTSLI